MYFNIFTDIEVDDRRMKRRVVDLLAEVEVREAQEIERPPQERDRPLPNRYDDDRRDRYDDRRFEQMQYADLYRFGY